MGREREEVTPAWWVASGRLPGAARPPRNPCKPVQPSLDAERATAGAAGEGSAGEGLLSELH